jgi:hypothetical protein
VRYETIAVHGGYQAGSTRAVAVPIYKTVAKEQGWSDPSGSVIPQDRARPNSMVATLGPDAGRFDPSPLQLVRFGQHLDDNPGPGKLSTARRLQVKESMRALGEGHWQLRVVRAAMV